MNARERVVVILAVAVAVVLVVGTVGVLVLEVVHPERDTRAAVAAIGGAFSGFCVIVAIFAHGTP